VLYFREKGAASQRERKEIYLDGRRRSDPVGYRKKRGVGRRGLGGMLFINLLKKRKGGEIWGGRGGGVWGFVGGGSASATHALF